MTGRIVLFALAAFSIAAAPAGKPKAAQLALELSFYEFASREEVSQEKLTLTLDAKNAEHAITRKGLEGWKARTLAREVKVNDKAEGYWVEVTLLAADGTEAGYLAATLPRDPAAAFSAATKVKAGKIPLNAVLTRAD